MVIYDNLRVKWETRFNELKPKIMRSVEEVCKNYENLKDELMKRIEKLQGRFDGVGKAGRDMIVKALGELYLLNKEEFHEMWELEDELSERLSAFNRYLSHINSCIHRMMGHAMSSHPRSAPSGWRCGRCSEIFDDMMQNGFYPMMLWIISVPEWFPMLALRLLDMMLACTELLPLQVNVELSLKENPPDKAPEGYRWIGRQIVKKAMLWGGSVWMLKAGINTKDLVRIKGRTEVRKGVLSDDVIIADYYRET